ncbi:hypothetical protein [Fusobacterium sp.]|uniref:hypothetical protein n=1 Tax=Fusobacterium sp. TaxID=68766 RepID=UPI0025C5BD81|nr:hypothetical protein [Fusobacterium sp.]
MKYFERVLNRMKFKFIPVISTEDNLIFGYKVMKDFSTLGFNDKEYMYQMAWEENIFDNFALNMFEKACKEILDKNFMKAHFFYTIRFNLLQDYKYFFRKIDEIIKNFNLDPELFIFDIKGVIDWHNFHKTFSNKFKYKVVIKEERNFAFNFSIIESSQAKFVEPRTLETLIFMKENVEIKQPLIFNLFYSQGLDSIFLKNLGIDYYYDSNN